MRSTFCPLLVDLGVGQGNFRGIRVQLDSGRERGTEEGVEKKGR